MKEIIYKIECEWDMGLDDGYYKTREAAMRMIQKTDWSDILDEGDTIESLMEDGLIKIVPVKLKDVNF